MMPRTASGEAKAESPLQEQVPASCALRGHDQAEVHHYGKFVVKHLSQAQAKKEHGDDGGDVLVCLKSCGSNSRRGHP